MKKLVSGAALVVLALLILIEVSNFYYSYKGANNNDNQLTVYKEFLKEQDVRYSEYMKQVKRELFETTKSNEKWRQNQDRFEKLLQRWEKQADRYDHVLNRLENKGT